MQDSPQKVIDRYRILRSLGKGGMGEVFLAYDPLCCREIALKQIREEMRGNPTIQERFLKEARIASQLSHPSIIPIYTIKQEKENSYYTMPYIEGETLKQIVRTSLEQEKQGEILHQIGSSIPILSRIFLTLCQAVRYIHSKGVLHRDLKPENVIVGKYGEVMILDWGLAEFVKLREEEFKDLPPLLLQDITKPGKIPGTVTYMAPERALGEQATFQTEIYSLGVILYQILTLHLPFQRSSLAEYRKKMQQETLLEPQEMAPHRDIPSQLADIAKKCLAFKTSQRYHHVDEVIADLEHYIEGKPKWIPSAHLNIDRKEDWLFQEHLLLAKHIALTTVSDVVEWVSMMISKKSFVGNVRLEAKVRLGEKSRGIGFLLQVSEEALKKGGEDGDCIWIGSAAHPGAILFRLGVDVMRSDFGGLLPRTSYTVIIEKQDKQLRCFVDNTPLLNYISHSPPSGGTRVGLLYRDGDFQLEELHVSMGSLNAQVHCLAIPDTFLVHKDYNLALAEYEKIAQAFSGRAEGREAVFRKGVALLEQGLDNKKKKEKERLFSLAQEEFSKLRYTPSAPLEYLGKSFIYKATLEVEEEIKCLELSLRKYPKHPQLAILKEHILFRLHETSHYHRIAAYHFALLALRQLPHLFSIPGNKRLIESLKNHWEKLPFLEGTPDVSGIIISLAFWLAKPLALEEILKSTQDPFLKNDAYFALLELGCTEQVMQLLNSHPSEEVASIKQDIASSPSFRAFCWIAQRTLDQKKGKNLLSHFAKGEELCRSSQEKVLLDAFHVHALLQDKQWSAAELLLSSYIPSLSSGQESPLQPLFVCFLWHTEGEEIARIHCGGISETPFPHTSFLLSHFLLGKISWEDAWAKQAFFYEKLQLLRQLVLFYSCLNDPKNETVYRKKLHRYLILVR